MTRNDSWLHCCFIHGAKTSAVSKGLTVILSNQIQRMTQRLAVSAPLSYLMMTLSHGCMTILGTKCFRVDFLLAQITRKYYLLVFNKNTCRRRQLECQCHQSAERTVLYRNESFQIRILQDPQVNNGFQKPKIEK
jgi:hypothetical protein